MASLNSEAGTVNVSKAPPPSMTSAAVLSDDPWEQLRHAPRVRIRAHKTSQVDESPDIFVGVNGIGYLIKRGEVAEVPAPVVDVLEKANRTLYRWERGADGQVHQIATEVPAYPFSRV